MKRNKPKEEDKEEEEEQFSLSKTTQIIVCAIVVIAVAFRLPPVAQGILFGFMPLIIAYDVERQRSAKKEGVVWS